MLHSPVGSQGKGKTALRRERKGASWPRAARSTCSLADAALGTGCALGLGQRPPRCLLHPPAQPITPRAAAGLRTTHKNTYGLLCVTRGPRKLENPTSRRGPGERIPAARCHWATQSLPASRAKARPPADPAVYPQAGAHSHSQARPGRPPPRWPPWSAQSGPERVSGEPHEAS